MTRVPFSLVVAATLVSTSAMAADMAVKAPPPAAAPSPWDIAITGALMSDYNFRGITQSNHQPSAQVGFEPRYNFTPAWQAYVGVSGESIDFPNRAAAEIDFYGGVRPTFGKLALDFGIWYYYYPDGQCFNTAALCNSLGGAPNAALSLPNGNTVKENLSFYEGYGKATVTVNDNFAFGAQIWGSPSVLNSGAPGIYYTGNVTLTAPTTWFPNGIGAYASADVGYWQLGTSDAFYAVPAFSHRCPLHELFELGRRPRLHLEGIHAGSALLRHQPNQGAVQRLYQRPIGDVRARQRDRAKSRRSRLQLVRRRFHRQAFDRHRAERVQIARDGHSQSVRPAAARPPAASFPHDRPARNSIALWVAWSIFMGFLYVFGSGPLEFLCKQ